MYIYYSLLYTTAHHWVPLIPKLLFLSVIIHNDNQVIYNDNALLQMFTLVNVFITYNNKILI